MPVVLAATVPSIADSEARHNDAKLNRQGLQRPANIRQGSDRSAGGAASHCVIGPMTTQARNTPADLAQVRLQGWPLCLAPERALCRTYELMAVLKIAGLGLASLGVRPGTPLAVAGEVRRAEHPSAVSCGCGQSWRTAGQPHVSPRSRASRSRLVGASAGGRCWQGGKVPFAGCPGTVFKAALSWLDLVVVPPQHPFGYVQLRIAAMPGACTHWHQIGATLNRSQHERRRGS
jgi:hypothetical protein